MIRAVILDCFGVLYVPVGEDFYRSHIEDYEKHKDTIQDLGRQADYGLISQDELVQAVSKLSGLDVETVREGVVSGMMRNAALVRYSQELRQQCKLGMLSNISAHTMDRFFTGREREQLFDDVVISSEVGLVKPHPAIFELAAQRLGVDASEVVMIDDSPANCSGAIEAGMQAIVYETFDGTRKQLEALLQ